jgi:hypothetical protein
MGREEERLFGRKAKASTDCFGRLAKVKEGVDDDSASLQNIKESIAEPRQDEPAKAAEEFTARKRMT